MKILFLSEPQSIHAVRWINQLADTDWELMIHPTAAPSFTSLPELRRGHVISVENPRSLIASLRHCIETWRPDVIHLLGLCIDLSNRGLTLVEALRHPISGVVKKPIHTPLVYSSWGADLDYWAAIASNGRGVRDVLTVMDYHLPECERDARLARSLGFCGTTTEKLPAFGGITWNLPTTQELLDVVRRRDIFIKARDSIDGDPVGRALQAVLACSGIAPHLREYQLLFAQARSNIQQWIERLHRATGLATTVLPRLPHHNDLLSVIRRARVAISLTINDGLPSTLVEAMSFGALPIFSNLSPLAEWITHGENGLLVDPLNILEVQKALTTAMTNDDLVINASRKNHEICYQTLRADVIQPKAIQMYERIFFDRRSYSSGNQEVPL